LVNRDAPSERFFEPNDRIVNLGERFFFAIC